MSASAHTAGQRRPAAPATGRSETRARASSHREAIRRRTRRIRRSVAILAVALFAAAFLLVYVQLASGHDPALVANARKRAISAGSASKAQPATTSSTSSGTSESSSASSEATGASSASGGNESSASAVTTSQS
ncbi:MAG: hypothetical protein JWN10_1480 [Solirubrobacterales bacterium]|nr:hypothetical protein [Solirubrobacterales bacterium]